MGVVVIIAMCVVAVGVSFFRIKALRARNRAEHEAEQKRTEAREDAAVNDNTHAESAGGQGAPKETFADYLDAENAPTLTHAQMDEWRRDFALACKYGRRPLISKAPYLLSLRAEGFSLPYKAAVESECTAPVNPRFLPHSPKFKSLAASSKAAYKQYIKSDESTSRLR